MFCKQTRSKAIHAIVHGATQTSVAKSLNCSNDTISRWWAEYEKRCGRVGREQALKEIAA